MNLRFDCGRPRRLALVREARDANNRPPLNAIDYVEVAADQRTLTLVFAHPLPGQPFGVPLGAPPLGFDSIVVEGGAHGARLIVTQVSASGSTLTAVVSAQPGQQIDFAPYTLRLVAGHAVDRPLDGFDPQLAAVELFFKLDCPDDRDCRPAPAPPTLPPPAPAIDYLARDYASFRRLMLDRLAATAPSWRERSPADMGVAIVELLAFTADHLSYRQDAAATEAYLGTARSRASVRRHARLLDYRLHDGCNARAWVVLEVDAAGDGVSVPGPGPRGEPGAQLLAAPHLPSGYLDPIAAEAAMEAGAVVFETMEPVTLRAARNAIELYTWGDEGCVLRRGATSAWLRDPGGRLAGDLRAGDLLVLEEIRGADSGRLADADPARRHAVRLAGVQPEVDPLFPEQPADPFGPRLRLLKVTWHRGDALPCELRLWQVEDDDRPGDRQPVTLARGNVVLADHGRTLPAEQMRRPARASRGQQVLERGPLVWQASARGGRARVDQQAAAATALHADPASALPAIRLEEGGGGPLWLPRRDLVGAPRFARSFVVETKHGGWARLRFGRGDDSQPGRAPAVSLRAIYRVGGGSAGNIGPEAITHIVGVRGVTRARNPLAAAGGIDPEPAERAQLLAPQTARRQERAVTLADYERAARRHPEVQRAVAQRRWSGSWHAITLVVDRVGGLAVDADFERELRATLEPLRMAGHDLAVAGPAYVPLRIALTVCVREGGQRGAVRAAIEARLGRHALPDGTLGLFHPDRRSFGEPVFLSPLIAAAMAVPGVASVQATAFERRERPEPGGVARGQIDLRPREIARLDNDPSRPEAGILELTIIGGV